MPKEGLPTGTEILNKANIFFEVHYDADTTNGIFITSDSPIVDNVWTFLAITFDEGASAGNFGKIYAGDLDTLATLRTLGTNTDPAGTK